MRIISAALVALMAQCLTDMSNGQASTSTYTYKPDGVIFNGKFLPGPASWPGQCNSGGQAQTPIAIASSTLTKKPGFSPSDYTFTGGNCTFNDLKYGVLDNGVKAYYDSPGCTPPSITLPDDPDLIFIGLPSLTITKGEKVFGKEAGKTYRAAQFHIHSSSEHTIDGNTFEAEMHIVHLEESIYTSGIKTIDDLLAHKTSLLGLSGLLSDGSRPASVVGYMLKSEATAGNNTLFENLLKGWEAAGCGVDKATIDASIVTKDSLNPYDFLEPSSCIFNYDGGLTTPDCDEIVEWNLAEEPIILSTNQMNRLLYLINGCPQSISFNGSTSRPLQNLNGREVNKICPATHRRRDEEEEEEPVRHLRGNTSEKNANEGN